MNLKKLQHKWDKRLAAEGMPTEVAIKATGAAEHDAEGCIEDTPRAVRWREFEHAITALPASYSKSERKLLQWYCDSGYLTEACRKVRCTIRHGRTVLARFVAHQKGHV